LIELTKEDKKVVKSSKEAFTPHLPKFQGKTLKIPTEAAKSDPEFYMKKLRGEKLNPIDIEHYFQFEYD
jgi:hypothetical protein